MEYIVVAFALALKTAAAIGACYADQHSLPYPIPGYINGQPIQCEELPVQTYGCTYFWTMPITSASGTEVAFEVDAEVEACLGLTYETSLGEVTIPSETQSLPAQWFPPPSCPPRGC